MSHIAVLKGGWSAERDVSLISGGAVANALRSLGHQVTEIDVRKDLPALLAALTPRPDIVFNALHGTGGEDGTIQGVLEMLGLPVTHSNLFSSAVAMDKATAKLVVAASGVRVPHGILAKKGDALSGKIMDAPFVVKPNAEGSSVGVHLILSPEQIDSNAPDSNDIVLVERYIAGRELTVAVMGKGDEMPRALTVTEIRPRDGFYDYAHKYTDGGAEHLLPAPIPAQIFSAVQEMAITAHRALGCRGVSRSDFRWDDRLGTDGLYFLETNTQPGMTPLSLVPEQAAFMGMDFTALVAWILEAAT